MVCAQQNREDAAEGRSKELLMQSSESSGLLKAGATGKGSSHGRQIAGSVGAVLDRGRVRRASRYLE